MRLRAPLIDLKAFADRTFAVGAALSFTLGMALFAAIYLLPLFLGIVRQLRAKGDTRPVRLLFANRHEGQIVYRNELDRLRGSGNCTVHYALSEPPHGWTGPVGVIDRTMLAGVFDRPDRGAWVYFVCGPGPMMDLVQTELHALGVPDRNIISERFRYE